MPTKRRRHTITEVGAVGEALERVRAVDGEPDVRELVVLGAEEAVRRAEERHEDAERRDRAKQSLIERMTTGEGIDLEAAEEVRRHGFSRRL
jgi:hypothetical protein